MIIPTMIAMRLLIAFVRSVLMTLLATSDTHGIMSTGRFSMAIALTIKTPPRVWDVQFYICFDVANFYF